MRDTSSVQGTPGASARQVRTLLARAYQSDPLMAWIFPDEESRLNAVAAWLGLFVESYWESDRVDVLGEETIDAVAIWRISDASRPISPASSSPPASPGPPASSNSPAAPAIPGPLPTISGLLSALVGDERASAIGQALAGVRELAPTEPYVYLHFLAVEPERQRQGLGRSVLEPGVRHADSVGLGVHLETTNADNHPFYRRLGFEISGHRQLSVEGPTLWTMWREPSTASST
ncbi:GNAT family N-acetyltransferase [Phytoactinopolyspora endophytica]|uniref:GNAT family N-acetyltransferase n=1 Tax=Phytoactinopolyspora endophytica TaxID=1642495 RepID=UPI00101BC2B1|nr:GNAT family N-acetyltransferase [Phytoactinopolyspora endophytica]